MTENNNIYCDPNVVGIALVVEEIGKGSNLFFKYQLHPQQQQQQQQQQHHHHHHNAEEDHYERSNQQGSASTSHKGAIGNIHHQIHSSKFQTNAATIGGSSSSTAVNTTSTTNTPALSKKNIFFRLKPRILAKLFRTKPPLCDQPVTLNMEGTLFCCRSVLLDPQLYQQQQEKLQERLREKKKQQQYQNYDDTLSVQSNYSKQQQQQQQQQISMNNTMSPNTTTTSSSVGGGTAIASIGTNNSNSTNTNTNTNTNTPGDTSNGLVLFSIIVAMKPLYIERSIRTNINNYYFSSIPIISSSNLNYINENNLETMDDFHEHHHNALEPSSYANEYYIMNYQEQKQQKEQQNKNNSNDNQQQQNQQQRQRSKSVTSYTLLDNRIHENASLHFPAVRRIHVTLSRLCKVLEREEKRCLYVSRQVCHLIQVANDGDGSGSIGNGDNGGGGGGGGTTTAATTTTTTTSGDNVSTKGSKRDASSSTSSNNLQDEISGVGGLGPNPSSFGATDNVIMTGNNNDIIPSTMLINGNIIEDALSMYNNINQISTSQNLDNNNTNNNNISKIADEDYDNEQQKRMDSMLAASPPPTRTFNEGNIDDKELMNPRYKEYIPIYGNLALELTQVYQALSRNAHMVRPSPDSLLSGRDGIVHINHHVAVKVEPVKASRSNLPGTGGIQSTRSQFLRSYHTLLFHPVRASDLLRHKLSKSTTREQGQDDGKKGRRHQVDPILRQMEKLLVVSDDPFKSLQDMASDTALPLKAIVESAMALLEAGVCIALPVMTPLTRFGCSRRSVERMATLKLEFAQQFGYHLPIHLVVSALTTVCPNWKSYPTNDSSLQNSLIRIGEFIEYSKMAMISFRDDEDDDDEVREDEDDEDDFVFLNPASPSISSKDTTLRRIPPIIENLTHRILITLRSGRIPPGFNVPSSRYNDGNVNSVNPSQMLEKAIISMTTWLRSRSVIVEQKEYLSSIPSRKGLDLVAKKQQNRNVEQNTNASVQYYESFYRDFIADSYISCGNVSTRALAWKYNKKLSFIEGFRDWGVKEELLTASTRIPTYFDDWGAP